MTERLQRVLAQIEQLPPEEQDAIAEQLELWTEDDSEVEAVANMSGKSFAGIWANLPDADTMIDELDRLRHESKPSPPLRDEDFA